MRRSIPALILGFLSGLLNLLWAYIFYFFGGLAFAFSNGETSYILIFSFVFLACAVIGIVGSFFCIKKANIGAIILLIASTPTSGFLLYSFITTLISGSFDFLQLFIAPIAILLMVLSVVCSFKSKSIDQKIIITNNNSVNNIVNVNVNIPNSQEKNEKVEQTETTVEVPKPTTSKDENK